MRKGDRTGIDAREICVIIIIAVLIAVLMTVLSAVPPLSIIYDWTVRNDLGLVWYGVIAGVIALCLNLYLARKK